MECQGLVRLEDKAIIANP